jgi:predicted DNA-binding transcriptional regulator YafY
MEALERLLNLVGMLLDTETPLTFDQIQRALEPYRRENSESAKRMFERDKDVLREYGIPLELVDIDAWGGEQGYIIPKDRYYLPEISFTPEELGALFVAAQSGGGDDFAERGVRKLMYGAGGGVLTRLAGGPLASGSDAGSDLVMAAAEAAQARRRTRFGYRTSQGKTAERDVDVFATVFRGGRWYLVGFDHGREDVRAFRLSRVTTVLVDSGPGIEPPAGFRAADHVEAGPWAASPEDRAVVVFAPDVSWWAAGSLAGADVAPATRADGWVEVALPFADEEALASVLLQFGADAVVESPISLRDRIIRRLEAVRG